MLAYKIRIASMGQIARATIALALAACSSIYAQTGCDDIKDSDFKKTVLVNNIDSPMKIAPLPDGAILYIERSGSVRYLAKDATQPTEALKLQVPPGSQNEDGLLGIALDPQFASNKQVFLFYTPAVGTSYRLSRFTLIGNALDAASEKMIIEVPSIYTSRAGSLPDGKSFYYIHGAGGLHFDKAGNVLIGTGDLVNTSPSDGYAPIDERTEWKANDAQGTSGNTNSLLGKILRITPKPEGGYTVPVGNLFPAGTDSTKPEIYAMGVRNPFTLAVDSKNGWILVGDVGPDANGVSLQKGPASEDEIHLLNASANLGWPYMMGDNKPYVDYDYATSTARGKFDPMNLINDSPRNNGKRKLPVPQSALFGYGDTGNDKYPGFIPGGYRCIKIGGFYRYDGTLSNAKRLPPYMDGGFFMGNHGGIHFAKFFKLDAQGNISAVKSFLTGWERPMAFEIGADGTLYSLEWGSDNGHWFNGKNGKLSRIDYNGACSITSSVFPSSRAFATGGTRLTVRFDGRAGGFAVSLAGRSQDVTGRRLAP